MAINQTKAMRDAYEREQTAKRAKEAVDGIATAGSGAVTFADIDKWLADNPDAEYFRVSRDQSKVVNNGWLFGGERQTIGSEAAIVGQEYDQNVKHASERYAHVGAVSSEDKSGSRRTHGNKATVDVTYNPSSWFADNGFEYDPSYGLIYSRDEYGKLKEQASKQGKSDQFLSAGAEKKPTFSSDYARDRNTILTGGSDNRRAALGEESDDSLSNESDANEASRRKILG